MDIRSLGFRTDVALLQKSGSVVEDRGTHLVVRTPDNPTYFWGNFILLREAPVPGGEREVVGAFWTEFPNAEHVAVGIDGTEPPDDLTPWHDAGLTSEVCAVLTTERLVQPLAPSADVEIRQLTTDDDWDRWARLGRAAYPKVSQDAFLAYATARNDQERRLVEEGLGARFGAFLDDELVSTAAVFSPEPGLARFQTVETAEAHRRQGFGASVVHAAGQHALTDLAAKTLVIVADVDGEAIGLYRRLGFTETGRQVALELAPPRWS